LIQGIDVGRTAAALQTRTRRCSLTDPRPKLEGYNYVIALSREGDYERRGVPHTKDLKNAIRRLNLNLS